MELRGRMKNSVLKRWVTFLMAAFTVFMVIGRLISGVHWLTDIVGGILISGGLIGLYHGVNTGLKKTEKDAI
jgi:undecaprenyl-diphosphatase